MRSNPTFELTAWFVREILQVEFDPRFAGQHLKSAKRLINPDDKDLVPLDPEIIKQTILHMRDGKLSWDGREITSLNSVTWGTPSYYQQMLNLIMQVPPPYEVRNYDTWVIKFGKLAKKAGVWDGTYLGWANPLSVTYRLTPAEVATATGD